MQPADQKTGDSQGDCRRTGLRLRMISIVVIAAAAAVCGILFIATLHTLDSYREMRSDTERYIEAEEVALDVQQASDYLTEQVRIYVVTGKPEHIRLYFEEANTARRRDQAVEKIRQLTTDPLCIEYLENAIAGSMELMQQEYHAMRLMLAAEGMDIPEVPKELRDMELDAEEAALSPEAQRALAQELVFGDGYLDAKAYIAEHVQLCTQLLTESTRKLQTDSSEMLHARMVRQLILEACLMMITVLTVIIIYVLIILPLERNVKEVQAFQPMAVRGAFELRFLSESYNQMYEKAMHDRDRLSYDASHDALTGLYNRRAYEAALKETDPQDTALLLIDVDYFKTVNDTYGHEIGDRVLRRVADVLTANFRREDMVCRIGGDEFAVIMVHVSSKLTELVAGKAVRMNAVLQHPHDDLPPVSLSIGIAFGTPEQAVETLVQNADAALYQVKNRGRKGFLVYSSGEACDGGTVLPQDGEDGTTKGENKL